MFLEALSFLLCEASAAPFFLELCAENSLMELQLCNRAAKELYLLEHDEIFRGNEKGEGVYILASGGAQYIQGTEFYQPLRTASERGTASTVIKMFSILPGRDGGEKEGGENQEEGKKSNEKPGVRVAAEDYLSEQALWVRGWKHQGRLEASVESRALHLATTEMKVVLRDHSDALAVTVVYARAFVDAMNALPLSDRSDLPLQLEQNPMVGQGISEGHRPSRHKVSPEIDCSG